MLQLITGVRLNIVDWFKEGDFIYILKSDTDIKVKLQMSFMVQQLGKFNVIISLSEVDDSGIYYDIVDSAIDQWIDRTIKLNPNEENQAGIKEIFDEIASVINLPEDVISDLIKLINEKINYLKNVNKR